MVDRQSEGQAPPPDNSLENFFAQYTQELEFPDIHPFLSNSQNWPFAMLAYEGNPSEGNVYG